MIFGAGEDIWCQKYMYKFYGMTVHGGTIISLIWLEVSNDLRY